ncbi:hypothetical protein [Flavobacterium terrisoli]|nr:hypothetical protein [Flavobacterium buctense]
MDINKKINALFGTIAFIVLFMLVFLACYMALFAPVSKISL